MYALETHSPGRCSAHAVSSRILHSLCMIQRWGLCYRHSGADKDASSSPRNGDDAVWSYHTLAVRLSFVIVCNMTVWGHLDCVEHDMGKGASWHELSSPPCRLRSCSPLILSWLGLTDGSVHPLRQSERPRHHGCQRLCHLPCLGKMNDQLLYARTLCPSKFSLQIASQLGTSLFHLREPSDRSAAYRPLGQAPGRAAAPAGTASSV